MYKNEGDSASVILKVDELKIQSSRILCRESSFGESSRIYHRSAEGVPFNWETQPGTPKNPRREEVIPPPTPPPGAQRFLPPIKHCAPHLSKEDSDNSVYKLWFWRKHWKRQQQAHNKDFGTSYHAGHVLSSNHKSKNSGNHLANFDGEFRGSWVEDLSISETDSSSSSNGSLHQSKDDHGVHKPFGCSPWNMTGVLVRVAKRA